VRIQKLGHLKSLNAMRARMVLGTPESKMFNGLRIQVNGVSAIPLLEQPVGIPEQNYAKTISRHPTASPFAQKYM
jgi:hypothetical protein